MCDEVSYVCTKYSVYFLLRTYDVLAVRIHPVGTHRRELQHTFPPQVGVPQTHTQYEVPAKLRTTHTRTGDLEIRQIQLPALFPLECYA